MVVERVDFLFKLLLILLPTQLAFHFWPSWAHVFGIRIDYFAPTLFLTDVVIFFILIPNLVAVKKISFFCMGLALFSLVNIYFAQRWQLALFKWIKIWELAGLVWILLHKKSLLEKINIRKLFSVSLILFSLLGIVQFFLGRTVGGPFYLLGERRFDIYTPGIALINLFGTRFLRAYSTFSHPNSLAGFLGLIILIYYLPMISKRKTDLLEKTSLVLIIICLILTFSLSAWVGLGISILVFLIFKKRHEQLHIILKSFLTLFLILSFIFPWVFKNKPALVQQFPESIRYRVVLSRQAINLMDKNILIGVGLNNFIYSLSQNKYQQDLDNFLQPVHNLFLLIFAEAGIIGLIALVGFLFYLIKIIAKKKSFFLAPAFIFFLITSLTDHYWFTLQQNLLLLVVFFSLILQKEKQSLVNQHP